jgi:hypothetical protein
MHFIEVPFHSVRKPIRFVFASSGFAAQPARSLGRFVEGVRARYRSMLRWVVRASP